MHSTFSQLVLVLINDNVSNCIYSTKIIEYNLIDAEDDEWSNLKDEIKDTEWNLIVNKDRDINDIVSDFNSKCEELVMKSMRRKDDMSENRTNNGNDFKSKNKIPRDVRKLSNKREQHPKH